MVTVRMHWPVEPVLYSLPYRNTDRCKCSPDRPVDSCQCFGRYHLIGFDGWFSNQFEIPIHSHFVCVVKHSGIALRLLFEAEEEEEKKRYQKQQPYLCNRIYFCILYLLRYFEMRYRKKRIKKRESHRMWTFQMYAFV